MEQLVFVRQVWIRWRPVSVCMDCAVTDLVTLYLYRSVVFIETDFVIFFKSVMGSGLRVWVEAPVTHYPK